MSNLKKIGNSYFATLYCCMGIVMGVALGCSEKPLDVTARENPNTVAGASADVSVLATPVKVPAKQYLMAVTKGFTTRFVFHRL